MNYLLSSEQAEVYLSHYYNYDKAFIVVSNKEATSGLQELTEIQNEGLGSDNMEIVPDYLERQLCDVD